MNTAKIASIACFPHKVTLFLEVPVNEHTLKTAHVDISREILECLLKEMRKQQKKWMP